MAADDDEVGAGREARVVDDPQAGVGDVVDERLRADDVGGPAVALGELELQRGADAQHLVDRGLEAELPELADEPLGRVAHVVGQKDEPLARLTQRGDGVDRAGDRGIADPDAAVEVEQQVVVRTDTCGDRHPAALSLPAVPRLLAVLIACLALVIAGCGDDSEEPAAESTATAEETPRGGACPRAARPSSSPRPRTPGRSRSRTEKLSKSKTYVATVSTTCGDFEITLDAKRAPVTGGSFKYLADQKFFDGTTFHRIVADFVIQGGDPAGDGSGGPGYSVEEAPPSSLKYTEGLVAMAKTQTEPAGTSGSQFFVVTGAGAASLTPDYALLGEVTKGMDVATKIGGIEADPNTGAPVSPVVIKSITVEES